MLAVLPRDAVAGFTGALVLQLLLLSCRWLSSELYTARGGTFGCGKPSPGTAGTDLFCVEVRPGRAADQGHIC